VRDAVPAGGLEVFSHAYPRSPTPEEVQNANVRNAL